MRKNEGGIFWSGAEGSTDTTRRVENVRIQTKNKLAHLDVSGGSAEGENVTKGLKFAKATNGMLWSEIFSMIDKDNSGQITRTEFAKWMRDLGIKVSMGDIRKFVERYDQSSDSLINYEEFLSIVAPNQYRESLAETNVEEQGPPGAKKERRERSKEHAAS